jgi:hypothetical protein
VTRPVSVRAMDTALRANDGTRTFVVRQIGIARLHFGISRNVGGRGLQPRYLNRTYRYERLALFSK